MSSPGPSGGSGPKKNKVKKKVTKKKKDDEDKVKKDGSATDETASNSDRREDVVPVATVPKPQSAGASMRDAAQRVLTLALKGEWTAAEGVIKSLEKAVEKAKAAAEEEIYLAPMASVLDPVSAPIFHFQIEINYVLRCNRTFFFNPF
jgi:hypothetical protein